MDIIFSKKALKSFSANFCLLIKKHSVVAFYAPMGAGKTTLITAICNELGVKSTSSSPTFSIINEYQTTDKQTIYHMDWYRLKDEEEAIQAGVEDALLSGHTCLVEWPEKAEGLLPDGTLHVCIEVLDDETRRIFTPSL